MHWSLGNAWFSYDLDEARAFEERTVVPGFVDTHAHLRARDELHRTDVWSYLANLAYGVTTTRDPQTGNTEVLSYADMVRAGTVLGPRIYSTGPGVFWQDGIDTEEEARDALKRYADYFDTKTIKMYVAAARKGRQHIIAAARELGLMPTTEGALSIRLNLTETLDGYPGLEHSIPIEVYPRERPLPPLWWDEEPDGVPGLGR